MILGPPSNQVSCTPVAPVTATHLVCCSSGSTNIGIMPLSDAIAGTGSWSTLFTAPSVPSGYMAFDLEAGLLFASRTGNPGKIWKMNMDGTGSVEEIYSGLVNIRALAINPEAQRLYFRGSSHIEEIDYDGNNQAVVTNQADNRGLWYDAINDWIYIADGVNDRIMRIQSDGSNLDTGWSVGPETYTGGAALSGGGSIEKLFYHDDTLGKLYETDIPTVTDTEIDTIGRLSGMVYDPNEDKLFYIASGDINVKVYDRATETITTPTTMEGFSAWRLSLLAQ